METTRRIRDNLHGTISLSPFEERILSHSWFQRLRYIRQLGFFHLVFPGAQHARFEHSLGVMHLASLSFAQLRENLKRMETRLQQDVKEEEVLTGSCFAYGLGSDQSRHREHPEDRLGVELSSGLLVSSYSETVLRIAALLHDIGHCPYSHCTERFLPTYGEIFEKNPSLPDFLKEAIRRSDSSVQANKGPHSLDTRSCHEAFSLLLGWHILSDLEKESHLPCYKEDVLALLNSEIKIHPQSPLASLGGYNILGDLLSGEWDVDRMDYLMRDSQQAGVEYGKFDVDRLLHSIYAIWEGEKQQYSLSFHLNAMPAFEDFLRARRSMFLQLYFHKTSVASEAMIRHLSRMLSHWSFPAKAEEYAALRDHDLQELFVSRLASQKHLIPDHYQRAQSIIRGLFCERRLWKKIYELSDGCQEIFENPRLQEIHRMLKEHSIPSEIVYSVNHLVSPSVSHSQKIPYKWITSDVLGRPKIFSIVQVEGGYGSYPSLYLARIYVDPRYDKSSCRMIAEL